MTLNNCENLNDAPGSPGVTLGDVLEQIVADQTLPKVRRDDMACAIRRLAKMFGRPPAEISADATCLRERLSRLTPAMVGLSKARFHNVISFTRAALNRTGVADWPAPHQRELSPEWRTLLLIVADTQERFWLSKFAGYCSAKDITPNQVNDAVVQKFHVDLDAATLKRKPATIHRKVCQFWNHCAVKFPGWPQTKLTVPDGRNSYALPWSAFSQAFIADLEGYLAFLAGGDVFAERDFVPLRPSSIATTREGFRQLVSALVHGGHDAQAIKCLKDLVDVELMKKALRFYTRRPNGSGNRQAHRLLVMVNTMAKRWAPDEIGKQRELKRLLTGLGKHLPNREIGLTAKNKSRLRQFESDGATVDTLLTAPRAIMAKLPLSRPPTHDEALMAQTALAIEILLMLPLRIKNLAGLNLETQVIRGRDGRAHITIASQDVKNRFDIEAPLPRETAELLDLYLVRFRPRLQNAKSPWLFPGRHASQPKSTQQLRKQIQDTLAHDFGLTVNPHLFRHIAAMFFLRANPGQYGTVQLLLAHRSIETTMRFYCGFETTAAVRHYDTFMEGRRDVVSGTGRPQ